MTVYSSLFPSLVPSIIFFSTKLLLHSFIKKSIKNIHSHFPMENHSNNNNNLQASPNRRPNHPTLPIGSRSSDFVRRLILMLIMAFFILGLVITIAWFVIHPIDPAVGLSSFSVSNITLSSSKFTATYDMEFTVNNTNKKVNVWIDLVRVGVNYGNDLISKKIFETSLYVGKRSQEKLVVQLGRESVYSVKDGVFKDISDNWSKKMVNFNVKLLIRATFEKGIWQSKQRFMEVLCRNATVEFLSTKGTGKLMGGGQGCSVRVDDSL